MFLGCNKQTLKKSDFQEVDFTEKQKIQVVIKNEIYNVMVSFNENNEFTFVFLDEAPVTYKNLLVEVKNDICTVTGNGLVFEKNINEFNNDFLPKIIYIFLCETDFNNADFTYNVSEKSCLTEKTVCEKTIVFTVQLSLDDTTQNYTLEVRWAEMQKNCFSAL